MEALNLHQKDKMITHNFCLGKTISYTNPVKDADGRKEALSCILF